MEAKTLQRTAVYCALCVLVFVSTAAAQLNNVFNDIFNTVLKDRLSLNASAVHARHYFVAAEEANRSLTPALNGLIAGNISSFPLSSTIAGVTFDFSSGQPMSITESLGPIFAETAEPLGPGKLNIGFNYTYLNFARLRGIRTEDIRFAFTHEDVDSLHPNLGDSVRTESDYIDIFMDIHLNASIFAFYATLGVTNDLDIGVALPIINVSLNGNAKARINSFTFGALGGAFHSFNADPTNPQLETSVPYDKSATGIGDLALRFKYSVFRENGAAFGGLLVDVRLPTGKEGDFLGSGKTDLRVSGILSKKMGDFTPNLNVGYGHRFSDDATSDKLTFAAGFDNKIVSGVSLAFEVLGEISLDNSNTVQLLPGSRTIVSNLDPAGGTSKVVNQIDLSNIPETTNDNTVALSCGLRYAPSERVIFLGNILVPLNDGGLRSSVAPTIGLSIAL